MRTTRIRLMLLVLGASFGRAACGGSGSSSGSPSNASAASTGGTIVIVTGTGTTAGSTQGPTTPSTTTTQNLVVTNTIRGRLLAAGAALHQLPVSDCTGLRKGETYYAFDPATNEHWAGAALVASKSSIKAQVGDQDDGAYLVFRKRAGGAWEGVGRRHPREKQLHLRGQGAGVGARGLELGGRHLPPPQQRLTPAREDRRVESLTMSARSLVPSDLSVAAAAVRGLMARMAETPNLM